MARTPTKTKAPAPAPALNESEFEKDEAAVRLVSSTQAAMDDALEAGRSLGHIESGQFFLTVGTSVVLAAYENVKKSKAWQHMANPQSSDGQKFASFDDFCRVKLGKSYARLQEITGNRSQLGEETFEQAERLGLHQRDYNAIKALPAPTQELVKQAIAEGSTRDDVIKVLRDVVAQDGAQITALQKEAQDARDQAEDLAASKKDLEGKVTQLRKEAKRLDRAAPDEVAAHLRSEIEKFALEAEGLVTGPIRDGLQQLREHADNTGIAQNDWMAGQLSQLIRAVKHAAARFGIELLDSETPAWAIDALADPSTASKGAAA